MTQTAAKSLTQLDEDYPLTGEQIAQYRRDGFIQLDNVLTGETLETLRDTVHSLVFDKQVQQHNEGAGYTDLFIQKVNLWEQDELVARFVKCRRLANLAAKLEGVAMRLWHDHALFKEPGKGPNETPWHQDAHYWPHQQKGHQTSVWIALRDANAKNGCMSFLPGTHHLKDIPAVDLKSPPDLSELSPELGGIKAKMCELKAGSVTFHNGLTFHYAGPNRSEGVREAIAVLYLPDGTTFSGQKHVCTTDLSFQVGDKIEGNRFPLVSDVRI